MAKQLKILLKEFSVPAHTGTGLSAVPFSNSEYHMKNHHEASLDAGAKASNYSMACTKAPSEPDLSAKYKGLADNYSKLAHQHAELADHFTGMVKKERKSAIKSMTAPIKDAHKL